MRSRLLLGLVLIVWLGSSAAFAAPRLEAVDGAWAIAGLPDLLTEEEIAGQLETGLTTTFALVASRGGQTVGGARIEIRYDLWDEVFRVRLLGADGRRQGHDLAGRDALRSWWRSARPVVLRSQAVTAGQEVRLRLDIIPFSQAEGRDTQRWFSDALGGSEAELDSDSVPGVDEVLGVLIATSIRRRALRTFRWTVSVPRSR
ncbi:MAG: hypothetical protein AAF604_19465 [Acidobacteriota bacterium]